MRGIRSVLLRSPIVIERAEPLCRCGESKDDGRHERAEDCVGRDLLGCHDPDAHHAYRAQTWAERFRRWDYWKDGHI